MSQDRETEIDEPTVVEALVAQLSLEEKCSLVVGDSSFTVAGCDRLDIPGWRLSDGPVGVRGMSAGNSLLVPCESALGATWDVELVKEIGVALGQEANDRHVDVLLGPTINLHRSPLGGRHFECFSEDPHLTADLAVAYIDGVQSVGVAACAKHLVCNDQEHERRTIDVVVDEKTLREVYLLPFEAAVRSARVRAVMAAYNYVNGDHCTAHPYLVEEVLKREWGFDGLVVSDWGAVKATLPPAVHGLDLEMPGPGVWWGDDQLVDAVNDGSVPESAIDEKVRRVLRLLAWRGRLPGTTVEDDEINDERPAHRELARRAATESMVLIKNDGILPLSPDASIALIGSGVARTALLGGGSASLEPYRKVNVLEAFRSRWSGDVTHAEGVNLHRTCPTIPWQWMQGPVKVEWFDGPDLEAQPVRVDERLAISNAWFAESIPFKGRGALRLSFRFSPARSGPVRMMGAGFGPARLFIDDELVTDNEVDGFVAGLGLRGGVATMHLDSSRTYHARLEAWAHPSDSTPFFYVDVGADPNIDQTDVDLIDEAAAIAAAADVAVVVVGTNSEWEAEDRDRENMALPLDQDELVRRVVQANPRTVVVLNCGSPVSLPWLDAVPAVLLAWYPGQEGGAAITDVLVGDAEPAGRMPTTWPRQLSDTPSYQWYPGVDGTEEYGEGVLVGHRWYDAHGTDPLIPFGHGGSYTTFTWGDPRLIGDGHDVRIEVPIRNVGDRTGVEVVQVYEETSNASAKPYLMLLGFARVEIAPGAVATASILLHERSFSSYDVAARRWLLDPGTRELVVAASVADRRTRLRHVLPA